MAAKDGKPGSSAIFRSKLAPKDKFIETYDPVRSLSPCAQYLIQLHQNVKNLWDNFLYAVFFTYTTLTRVGEV